MKQAIIRFLGGYSAADVKKIENENAQIKIHMYRIGDPVYVKRDDYNPFEVYYLLEPYNGNTCWYVGRTPESKDRSVTRGVNYKQLSFTKPTICPCCHKAV